MNEYKKRLYETYVLNSEGNLNDFSEKVFCTEETV